MQCVFSDCYGIKLETNNRKKKKKESASQYGRHRNASLTSGWGRFPGGGHVTHSSILVWRILWTEEPGRLQSMGLQRTGQS